ncbi:hypothetical protein lerEdw1_016778 [Lerista edwardsae]|nr:hypothetical protein lerEdw1_016778 [Lerista edwardsae]
MEGAVASWDVSGVRITPRELRFLDTVPGERYRATLKVRNLQQHSVFLYFLPPQKPQFRLIVDNPKKHVACGLQVIATVEYHPDKEEDLQDRLILYVGDKTLEIPVIGLIPSCCLEIEPEINFGTVIANSKVINAGIRITNHGSSPGAFNIKYKGSVPIVITPSSGIVQPKAVVLVIMEICTDLPRIINQPAIVELQGRSSAEIMIKANIVEQMLELLGLPHSDRIGCIHFGCVYFGTSKTEQVILHNKSPEPMNWVAILQDNVAGVEMGTDLQKSTDAVLKDLQGSDRKQGQDVSTLISCIPNEGTLQPYQKILVTLCFSPKQLKRDPDLDRTQPRQDYALFLNFEAVGSKDDFIQILTGSDTPTNVPFPEKNPQKVELGLTGSGLPVKLTFSSGPLVNFMECFMGEHTDILCTLKNECSVLPVSFAFHKIANFNTVPEKGKIKPQAVQDVVFSFVPRHIGTFTVKQLIDIIGPVTTKDNLLALKMKPFHQICLSFTGICKSVTKKIVLKTHHGITPLVTNEMGVFVGHKKEQCSDVPPVVLLKSKQTQIHTHQINRDLGMTAVALPNDRRASVRPELHKDCRTIFTKVARYHYVDPEFTYTVLEELEKQANRDHYADYIRNLRQRRLNKKSAKMFEKLNNPVDIGLNSLSGMKSPTARCLSQGTLEERTDFVNGSGLLTTQKLAEIESTSIIKKISDGLNPVPSSPQEVEDCGLILTPKQLHQIFIGKLGPTSVQFKEQRITFNHVPLHLTTTKTAILQNMGHNHAFFQVRHTLSKFTFYNTCLYCQVIDSNPLPGMILSPYEGVVPVGGRTELKIYFTPNALMKFDSRVEVVVRHAKSSELRIGGSVDVPDIDISVVAAYDFSLLIKVNVNANPNTSMTYPTGSAKHIIVPRPQPLTIPTLECKVQAIALQAPLEVSPLELKFQYSFRSMNLGVVSDSKNRKKLKLKNISKKQLTWKLDLDAAGNALDDGVFKFSLHTGLLSPGQFTIVTVFFCPRKYF